MRTSRIALVAGLLLAAQVVGTGCILVPKLEDRNVRLVVARIATVPLHATGSTNTFAGANTVDLRDSVDLASAVDAAGIDLSKVDKVVLTKVEYRVVVADANPSRQITNGNVQVSVGSGSLTPLMTGFSHSAAAVTPWLTAPLNSAGVTQINNLLAAILTELQGGAAADQHIGYAVSGTSAPTSAATDFWYEIRITIQVSGTQAVKILN
jgi:hypothetical protein